MGKIRTFIKKNLSLFAISLVAILFAVAGILSCCFLIPERTETLAAAISGTWTDNGNYSNDLEGQGTENSPYLIKNEAQFAYIAVKANAGGCVTYAYYKLEVNLDLSAHEWVPIGNSSDNYFNGSFDFGNHVIKGMVIKQNYDRTGLFGYAGGNFKNLKIYDARIEKTEESRYQNALFIANSGITNTNIDNFVVTGKISGPLRSASAVVGAVSTYDLSIKNTFVDVEIETNFYGYDSDSSTARVQIGGLVATSTNSLLTIENCRVGGKLISNSEKGTIGGLVAWINSNSRDINIKQTSFNGYIKQMSTYPSPIDAVGGIIGHLSCASSSVIEDVSADVQILHNRETYIVDNTEKYNLLHGFVGYADATYRPSSVNNCFYSVKKAKTDSALEATIPTKKFIGDFGGTEQSNWAVIDGLNNGLPILKAQYWIAKKSSDTGEKIVNALKDNGFSESNTALKIEDYIPRVALYTVSTSVEVASGALNNNMQVTFSSRGIPSGVTSSSNLVYGQKIELGHVDVAGYTFVSYSVNDISVNRELIITADTSIVGTYKANEYVITFNVNAADATVSSQTQKVIFSTVLATLQVPTRTGYSFGGWFSDNALSLPVTDGNGTVIRNCKDSEGTRIISAAGRYVYTSNITLYAKWEVVTYSITYNLSGGTLSEENPTTYTIESETFTLNNPTRTGYTFTGWTGSNGTTTQTTVTIAKGSTGAKSYTAKWTPISYNITYNLNGGTATNPKKYTIETATFTLNKPTRTGYTFTGWTGTSLSSATKTVTIPKGSKGDRTYTAHWTANTYTVTFDYGIGLDERSWLYQNPSLVNSNYTTSDNNTKNVFKSWTVSGDKFTIKMYGVSGWEGRYHPLNVETGKTYTLTFNYTLPTWAAQAHYQNKAALRTSILKREPVPTDGYCEGDFVLATTDLSVGTTEGTATLTFTATAAQSIYYLNLAFGCAPDGTDLEMSFWNFKLTYSTNKVTYNSTYGTLPTLTKDGYKFNGWYTARTGGIKIESTTKVSITTGQTLYAQWKQNLLNIYYDKNGGTLGSDSAHLYDGETVQTWGYGVWAYYGLTDPVSSRVTRTGYTADATYLNTAANGGGANVAYNDLRTTRELASAAGVLDQLKVGDVTLRLYVKWVENSSYLLSSWQTKVAAGLSSNVSTVNPKIKTIEFTRNKPSSGTPISVGATSAGTDTSGSQTTYTTTTGVDDVKAYVTTNSSGCYDIKIYSPCTIYFPVNSSYLFANPESSSLLYENYGLRNLLYISFSNISTSKVTNMSGMFNRCSSLTSLDVSKFDTSKVTDMSWLFGSNKGLSNLNVSNFSTSNVTNMLGIFGYCSALTFITGLDKFDTSSVEIMSSMFLNCSSLTSLNLSNFDTSNVTGMVGMFADCSSLSTLDLSSFNMENVITEINGTEFTKTMLTGMTGLKVLQSPKNVKVAIDLPTTMYNSSYTSYTTLPKNTSSSIDLRVAYTVTFNLNGGTISPTPTGYTNNGSALSRKVRWGKTFAETYGAPPDPERGVYEFAGWWTKKKTSLDTTKPLGAVEITKTTEIKQDYTLYAWFMAYM